MISSSKYAAITDLVKDPKTKDEIMNTLGLNLKQLRYNLRVLIKAGLIKKIPNLKDMRSAAYVLVEAKY